MSGILQDPEYNDQSHDHMLNHPGHFHHGDDQMWLPYFNRFAPCNDDQLPAISRVGRGLSGDSFIVRPKDDGNCEEFYLQGFSVDASTGEEHLEWESRNISGGWLHDLNHTYRMRPWNDPPTFNMTFIYHKPPCCSWAWTTPAIPYCWDEKGPYPEKMVGTGVATLFVRTDSVDHGETIGAKGNPVDNQWIEKLIYPEHTTRENFNAPDPLEEWTVNLTFGLLHGDVLVPNLYDLADMLGFGAGNIYNSVDGKPGQYSGGLFAGNYDDLKHYIDGNDKALLDHLHKDLGFDPSTLPDDTGDHGGSDDKYSAKDYTDWWVNFILNRIVQPESNIRAKFSDAQALQMFNRDENRTQNNWPEPHLGGEILISPSAGMMFVHFAYNTAINNGLHDHEGNVLVSSQPTVWNPADASPNGAIIDLKKLVEYETEGIKNFMPQDYSQAENDPTIIGEAGLVFVTAGGAQPYVGGVQVSNEVGLSISHDGFIKVHNAIAFSPYIYQELLHGNDPNIVEWEITISGTMFISLDKKWNKDMPWYKEQPGYADPLGHPSKPPQEMFKDIFELGTKH